MCVVAVISRNVMLMIMCFVNCHFCVQIYL